MMILQLSSTYHAIAPKEQVHVANERQYRELKSAPSRRPQKIRKVEQGLPASALR